VLALPKDDVSAVLGAPGKREEGKLYLKRINAA